MRKANSLSQNLKAMFIWLSQYSFMLGGKNKETKQYGKSMISTAAA